MVFTVPVAVPVLSVVGTPMTTIPPPDPSDSTSANRQRIEDALNALKDAPQTSDTPSSERPVGECEIAAVAARRSEAISFNLLVAGESSLGKTTSSNSMFRRYTDEDALLRLARRRESKEASNILGEIEGRKRDLQQLETEFNEKKSIAARMSLRSAPSPTKS